MKQGAEEHGEIGTELRVKHTSPILIEPKFAQLGAVPPCGMVNDFAHYRVTAYRYIPPCFVTVRSFRIPPVGISRTTLKLACHIACFDVSLCHPP